MDTTELKRLFEDAQDKETAAKEAKECLVARVRAALSRVLPPGTVVDLTHSRGNRLPDHLVLLRTIGGSDHGTRIFRVESIGAVDLDLRHPEASRWTCEATPISAKTGKDMDGSVKRSFRGPRTTVTLSGHLVCSRSPDEEPDEIWSRFLGFVAGDAATEESEPTARSI